MSEDIKNKKKKTNSNKTNKKQQNKKVKENKIEHKEKEIVKESKVDKTTDKTINKSTNKKTNTSKKNNISKKTDKKQIKKDVVKEEVKVEEKEILKEEEVLVKKDVVVKKKKSNFVLLIVLGCIILFLLLVCVIVRKWYLPSESYSFDYLNMRTIGYSKDEGQNNRLVSEDGKCIIAVTTEIIDEVDMNEMGTLEEIKNKEWARQDFANGVTWLTYHKDMLYIVQMYATDNETYKNVCREDFDRIKKTFSFLKDE